MNAATSANSAYQTANTVAASLPAYENISQTLNFGALGPLGSTTFSTSNVAMSCIPGVDCGGMNSAAVINNHSFTVNFQNATVSNNYNISFSNFNGYTGTINGVNSPTPISWGSDTIISLPVSGQTSTAPVSAAMDLVLTSVGLPNVTKRANLATVFTSINSGTAYMGVGNGYKILGR